MFPLTIHRSLFSLLSGITLLASTAPVCAQVESYTYGRGSNVGAETKVVADCKKSADGIITCDTKLENSKSGTSAKPEFSPFTN